VSIILGANWSAYRLEQIWEILRDEDLRANWIQDGAWQRMARLCEDQAAQMEKALNQLLSRWSDGFGGGAASSFAEQVRRLVASMRESASAAWANQAALRKITDTLAMARVEIMALVSEAAQYAYAEQQMNEYLRASGRFPRDTSTPPPVLPPRPPDNWWETLNQRARDVMAKADADVGAASAGFVVPAAYTLNVGHYGPVGFGTGQVGGSASVPQISVPSFDPPSPPALAVPGWAANLQGILSRPDSLENSVLAGSPSPGGFPAGDPPESSQRWDVTPVSPSGALVSTPLGGVLGLGRLLTRASVLPGAATPSPRPPHTPRPTTSTAQPRPAGAPATAAGRGGAIPLAPMVPPPAARPTLGGGVVAAGRVSHGRRLSPGDPWAAREGVPPVLQPHAERADFTPGLGVIGLDR